MIDEGPSNDPYARKLELQLLGVLLLVFLIAVGVSIFILCAVIKLINVYLFSTFAHCASTCMIA